MVLFGRLAARWMTFFWSGYQSAISAHFEEGSENVFACALCFLRSLVEEPCLVLFTPFCSDLAFLCICLFSEHIFLAFQGNIPFGFIRFLPEKIYVQDFHAHCGCS